MATYLVFARTEYVEPLEHRGEVEAADNEEAGRMALERFGSEWLEMTLVPEGEIHWVQRDEAEVQTS